MLTVGFGESRQPGRGEASVEFPLWDNTSFIGGAAGGFVKSGPSGRPCEVPARAKTPLAQLGCSLAASPAEVCDVAPREGTEDEAFKKIARDAGGSGLPASELPGVLLLALAMEEPVRRASLCLGSLEAAIVEVVTLHLFGCGKGLCGILERADTVDAPTGKLRCSDKGLSDLPPKFPVESPPCTIGFTQGHMPIKTRCRSEEAFKITT